ncbi:hypothetical protein ACODM8_14515 [Vibrio ostreicida]|uniref:hypothetical protein n=1 Tax=Vibrio ostreicida TaxID=526588 RepID=UPI003B5C6D24
MMKSCVLVLCMLVCEPLFARELLYPNIDGVGEQSLGFAVLQLVIDKSGTDMTAVVDTREVNQNRMRQLVENNELDLFDTGFDETLEGRFTPIYLPIEMGLLGWRLFIIHKDTQKKISQVENLAELTKFVMGQGQGWGDIRILQAAGLKVTTAPRIETLIQMIGGKRFDLFPLGANEVYQFLETYRGNQPDIVVDDSIVLIYPYGRFFYVRLGDDELALMLTRGLEQSFEDGSLQALLASHPFSKDAFLKANLNQRTQIRIPSPILTESFNAIDDKWWFTP